MGNGEKKSYFKETEVKHTFFKLNNTNNTYNTSVLPLQYQ